MRRKDRMITDTDTINEIIDRCDVIRIALKDKNYPYIVPLNFGYLYENGAYIFYRHAAPDGRKIELIKKDNSVAFEMDTDHNLVLSEGSCGCTMKYSSVMGEGKIDIVEDLAEKQKGLNCLMSQYLKTRESHDFSPMIERTVVLKLRVSAISCKKNA